MGTRRSIETVGIDSPLDESQLQLVRLWHERRGDRRWPARGDFDLPDFAGVIGRVALLDVVEDDTGSSPFTLRYRLWGTWITNEIGQDLTGLTIDALLRDWQRDMVRRIYDRVVEHGRPVVATRIQVGGDRSMGHCLVSLPLGEERVEMALTVYGLLPSTPVDWRGPWALAESYELHQRAYDLNGDGTLPDDPYAHDAALLEPQDEPASVSPVPGMKGGPRCHVPIRKSRRL